MDQVSKEKSHNYIFPDFLAKFMSRVDLGTQYEASLMSLSFMMLGLIVSVIYMLIYINLVLWYKIFLVFNGLAGLLFMWSYIVTTFQQYKTFMQAKEIQKIMKGGIEKDAEEIKI